jgi:hypothetical protein
MKQRRYHKNVMRTSNSVARASRPSPRPGAAASCAAERSGRCSHPGNVRDSPDAQAQLPEGTGRGDFRYRLAWPQAGSIDVREGVFCDALLVVVYVKMAER